MSTKTPTASVGRPAQTDLVAAPKPKLPRRGAYAAAGLVVELVLQALAGGNEALQLPLLLAPDNSALCPRQTAPHALDALLHPLPSYWISTSAKSFLTGHQLCSRTAAGMVRRLLDQGVRGEG